MVEELISGQAGTKSICTSTSTSNGHNGIAKCRRNKDRGCISSTAGLSRTNAQLMKNLKSSIKAKQSTIICVDISDCEKVTRHAQKQSHGDVQRAYTWKKITQIQVKLVSELIFYIL